MAPWQPRNYRQCLNSCANPAPTAVTPAPSRWRWAMWTPTTHRTVSSWRCTARWWDKQRQPFCFFVFCLFYRKIAFKNYIFSKSIRTKSVHGDCSSFINLQSPCASCSVLDYMWVIIVLVKDKLAFVNREITLTTIAIHAFSVSLSKLDTMARLL